MVPPYRVADDPGELPPLPLRGFLRPIGVVALLVVGVVSAGIALRSRHGEPSPRPPRSFEVAELLQLDADSLAALQGHTVIVQGVVRDRGHDSFLNEYVELDRGLGWEVPIFQCILADGQARTLPRGSPGRFRARVVGVSLGVAVQADACTPLP